MKYDYQMKSIVQIFYVHIHSIQMHMCVKFNVSNTNILRSY